MGNIQIAKPEKILFARVFEIAKSDRKIVLHSEERKF